MILSLFAETAIFIIPGMAVNNAPVQNPAVFVPKRLPITAAVITLITVVQNVKESTKP